MARAQSVASLKAAVSFFFCVGVLAGQVRTGNIYGRITDKEGMGLSQVKVTLNAPGVSPLFSETRGSGLYHFISLSPGGQYAITAELEGYKGATRTGLVVQVGVNTECDIILERISAVIYKKRAAILAFDRLVAAPSPLTTRDFFLFVSGEVEGDITAILDYIFGPDIREFIPDVRDFSIVLSEMLNGDIYAARSAIRILGYVKNEWQKPPGQKLPILLRIGGAVGELIRRIPLSS